MTVSHDAMDLSADYDCGIFRPCSLTILGMSSSLKPEPPSSS